METRRRATLSALPVLAAILVPIVVGALITGVLTGLARVGGAGLPAFSYSWAAFHGPFMVLLLLGTVISVERAKAMGRAWAWLAPILNALGALLFIGSPLPPALGAGLVLAGNGVLAVILGMFFWKERALFSGTLWLGSLFFAVGNGAWLLGARPISEAVPWWIGFLVLTIAGERLELGRLVRIPALARWGFALLGVVLALGAVLGPGLGAQWVAIAMTGFSAWLLRYDVALRTIRFKGLPRFIAACLILGNLWLGVGGILSLLYGGLGGGAGPIYDAILHAVFVGFVFSMIFGHAPVILPAVTGVPVPFRRLFYGHLAVLHLSLLLRVAGDVGGSPELRQMGAWGNAGAIVLFFGVTAWSILTRKRPLRVTS